MPQSRWRTGLLVLVLGFTSHAQVSAKADAGESRQRVFAWVNGEAILQGTYETALRVAGRQRFYHGKAPEAELVVFRKEVAERLINEQVQLQQAKKLGLQPDNAWVNDEFVKIDRRYSASREWHEDAGGLKRQIRDGLEDRSLIQQVDTQLRQVAEPGRDQVAAYYREHPDKFTSPEQVRVDSILLRVEPWQTSEVWDATQAKAKEILADIRSEGRGFDTYAKQYPPLEKAQLGYLHRGMLGEAAQVEIDKLDEGQISEVVMLLEGFAIFRLDERVPARLNPLDKVYERAAALLKREQSESAYAERTRQLRETAAVRFADPYFYEVPSVATLRDGIHGGGPADNHKKE